MALNSYLCLWPLPIQTGATKPKSAYFAAISRFGGCARFGSPQRKWPGGEAPTLVFKREDLGKIWRWEIASGHHPTRRSIPQRLGLNSLPDNPSLPPDDIQSKPPSVAYPPRPVSGSIADLDVIIEHCDFGEGEKIAWKSSVSAAGLDNGNRIRRGRTDDWKYIMSRTPCQPLHCRRTVSLSAKESSGANTKHTSDEGFTKSRHAAWEPPSSPASARPISPPTLSGNPATTTPACSTCLHRAGEEGIDSCTPQLWIWVNPGPAAAVSDSATLDLFDQLKRANGRRRSCTRASKTPSTSSCGAQPSSWTALSETRDDWRARKTLFKSGGVAVGADGNIDLVNRTGSQSADLYDKLSVIVSDMARFVLCHKEARTWGIYVDADTLFLRDWEEMWGVEGRVRLSVVFPRQVPDFPSYNTAVLRLRKGSALGHFLLRTAVKNGFDFHPFETPRRHVRRRVAEHGGYQRERPPQPYFTAFEDFFVTPLADSGAPLALGFQGFFSGAYSYHFHNSWWKPVDAAMNWPDLGPNFPQNGPEDHRLAQDRRD
ncbi:hypothetical protein B0H14DRAFT_3634291 [Mycena olivaceomarginata]|nr:hypothetical protein B0H14DRAFT_3634291 [Mycena olivaceomarginata]